MKVRKMVLDKTKHYNEVECFSRDNDAPYGFRVEVKMVAGPVFRGAVQVYNNVTEIHWRYDKKREGRASNQSVALETDIHKTGFTHVMYMIDSVTVTRAEKIENNM